MAFEIPEIEPRVISSEEAYRGGKAGYRIKVELSGNPFKGNLASAWVAGWKEASMLDKTAGPKIDYLAIAMEEQYRERRSRPNKKRFTRNRSEER